MSAAFLWVPVAALVALSMDGWAAFLHGRVWHGWLWPVHRSHHRPRRRGHRLEANDALSLLHAPVAVALVLYGCRAALGVVRDLAFAVGIGMAVFGVAYVLVHDGLIHGRLPVRFLLRSCYLRRVCRAHRLHHATGGAPYGLFFGTRQLARMHGLKRPAWQSGPRPAPIVPSVARPSRG